MRDNALLGCSKGLSRERETRQARRPKLLFLACYFPPVQAIASVRTRNIAKYLARLGWEVTVVTPDPSVWRNVEDSEKVSKELEREGIKRILTGHRWRCLQPQHLKCWDEGMGWVMGGVCRTIARYLRIDTGIGWMREAERAVASLTSTEVDVILASGPPFSSFTLAKRLSHRLGCPYVLDYRDPWTSVHSGARAYHGERRIPAYIMKLEADLVQSSSAITIVSKSLLNGRFNSKTHVITNGFDPEEMASVQRHDFGHHAIVYTGSFHPTWTAITPVMKALRRLLDERFRSTADWRFHYYGPQGDYVQQEAMRVGVMEKVVVHGRVSRREALAAMKGASVAVVITSVLDETGVADRYVVTGKLFDSLGLGVPTLLIGPPASDAEVIAKTSGLAHSVIASNVDGMCSFLKAALSGAEPEPLKPDTYAWPNISIELDKVLRHAISVSSHA
jgi:glycosyltransferase involved in cell wall biosynthesis